MPKRIQKRGRKTKARKPPRPRPTKSTKRTTFGGLIATGVRSLVSLLPGSAFLLPLYDMAFSSVAIDNKKLSTGFSLYNDGTNKISDDGIAIHGLSGTVVFNYASILVKAPGSVSKIVEYKDANRPGDIHPTLETSFLDARLIELVITAAPDSKSQYRAGRWGMVFIPFRADVDGQTFTRNYVPMSLSSIQEMSGCVSGPSDKSLTLRFKPSVHDGRLNSYNMLDAPIGALLLCYDNDLRLKFHEFTTDEFAPYISIRGRMEMRTPVVGSDESRDYRDLMWTSPIGMCVNHSGGRKTLLERDGLEVTPSTRIVGSCVVRGHRHVPNLDQMALE